MKALKPILFSFMMLLTTSCGIGDKLERITNAIEDVTNSAISLMEKINDISRLVDSKLESGEINQDIADLIDGRLSTLAELLESTMQNTGGYFFARVDASVNNVFMNLSNLLDQIQTGILGQAIPAIIDQISAQMQMQISTISGSIEDIIVVASGQAMIVVDKATNGIVIVVSVILLAIALIIFAIILLRRGRKMTIANYIGLGFASVFVVFFMVLILSPSVRGNVITGFDFASKVNTKQIEPKISGVSPETIIVGKTRKVYIYGNHLNKLENIAVKLTQGDQEKFSFPKSTIIVATYNRIVLGNLDRELSWQVPLYPAYRSYLMENQAMNLVNESQAIQANSSINRALFEGIKPMNIVSAHAQPHAMVPVAGLHPASIAPVIHASELNVRKLDVVKAEIGQMKAEGYLQLVKNFFFNRYRIAEGDYGLRVFADTSRIESAQLLSVIYPAPPVPKPDIFVMDLNWAGGVIPAAGQSASLDVTFGFSNPEQISRSFSAKITSVPVMTPIEVTVPMGKIAAASSGNKITVTSRVFSVTQPGQYNYIVSVDELNAIDEKDETNNTSSKALPVAEYKYDVAIGSLSYEPIGGWAGSTKIHCLTQVDASGAASKTCSREITPAGNMPSAIDCDFQFPGMKKGQLVALTFNAQADISFFWMNSTFNLGNVTWSFDLDERPTDGLPSKDYPILRETKNYKLHGVLTVTRRN